MAASGAKRKKCGPRSQRDRLRGLYRTGGFERLTQYRPMRELGRKVEPGVRRASRGQCQIGEVCAPREVPVIEAASSGSVEGDGADQRMGVEQSVDRVWPLAAD